MKFYLRGSIIALGLLVLAHSPGCGPNVKKVESESSNLKPLMVLYGQYTGQHRGQPPANEAEFKAYVKSLDKATLDSLKVPDADSLFISPRDSQPYVILYGVASGPPGPDGKQAVLAYEQTGVNGKRFIARGLGAVEEVSEAQFREAVPNPK